MATQHSNGGPSGLPSAALLESAIRRLSRSSLASLCEQLIDRLDAIDGDCDFEETDAEDSFVLSPLARSARGAGCVISDPDAAVDDTGCDGETDSEPRDHSKRPCRYAIDQRLVLPRHPEADGIAYRHD